jgi:hypothetical protein
MRKLSYLIGGSFSRAHDAAILVGDEEEEDALRDAVLGHISTDVMITINNMTMHLAGWLDPEHWSEDWEAKGIDPDDVHGLLVFAVEDV